MNDLEILDALGTVSPADPAVIAAAALALRAEADREGGGDRPWAPTPTGPRPRPARQWIGRHRLPVAAGSAAGVAAAVATGVVIALAGPGAPKAFASWTPTPTTPAPGQLSTADAACVAAVSRQAGESGGPFPSGQGSWRPALDDSRGPYTLVLLTAAPGGSSDFGACLAESTPQGRRILDTSITNPSPTSALPGALAGITFGGDGQLTVATGEAGAGVTEVSFTLSDASVVRTTVEGGLYAAWWPSKAAPVSVEVTTASGSVTERFPAPGTPVGGIPAGEVGPAGTTAPPAGAGNGSPSPSGASSPGSPTG